MGKIAVKTSPPSRQGKQGGWRKAAVVENAQFFDPPK
jgi:hypothetical protein